MHIIKQGDLRRLDTTRRFQCGVCGCVWDANASEYRKEYDRCNIVYACECPTCKKPSYDSKRIVEE